MLRQACSLLHVTKIRSNLSWNHLSLQPAWPPKFAPAPLPSPPPQSAQVLLQLTTFSTFHPYFTFLWLEIKTPIWDEMDIFQLNHLKMPWRDTSQTCSPARTTRRLSAPWDSVRSTSSLLSAEHQSGCWKLWKINIWSLFFLCCPFICFFSDHKRDANLIKCRC